MLLPGRRLLLVLVSRVGWHCRTLLWIWNPGRHVIYRYSTSASTTPWVVKGIAWSVWVIWKAMYQCRLNESSSNILQFEIFRLSLWDTNVTSMKDSVAPRVNVGRLPSLHTWRFRKLASSAKASPRRSCRWSPFWALSVEATRHQHWAVCATDAAFKPTEEQVVLSIGSIWRIIHAIDAYTIYLYHRKPMSNEPTVSTAMLPDRETVDLPDASLYQPVSASAFRYCSLTSTTSVPHSLAVWSIRLG